MERQRNRQERELMTSIPIPPAERRELRSVVRQQFKVLRTEVKQREAELLAEAERRLVDRYRDEDKRLDDVNWQVQEIAREAQRQIDDLLKKVGGDEDGGRWNTFSGQLRVNRIVRHTEDRGQLRRALEAGIKEQVRVALLALDRQEADLLKVLALDALESDAAREFLTKIPTVAELVPSARLREIEAAWERNTAS